MQRNNRRHHPIWNSLVLTLFVRINARTHWASVTVRPLTVLHAPIAEPVTGGQTGHPEAPPVPAANVVIRARVAEHEVSFAVGFPAL